MPASTTNTTKSSSRSTGDTPPPVALNLDTLEREGGEPDPFVFVLGGDRFVCRDIENEDWQVLSKIDEENPEDTFRLLLGKDFDKFAKHKLPLWKLKKLMQGWREHTGALDMGEG